MKKFTKLLSVFLIAGAVGTGVAGVSACSNNNPPEHTHTADTIWHTDANKHWHECTSGDGEKMNEADHADANSDGKCDVCDYQMTTPADGYVVEATTTGLQVEGVQTTYNLSTSLTSATVDISAIKVYLDNQGTKGKEVPTANYTVELYDGTIKLTSMSGLKKNGTYTLIVTLVNAKKPDGSAVAADTIYKQVTITVNNAYTAIALKSGTTSFMQGTTASTADWVIEATRANGDKEDIPAANVEIGSIDTVNAGTQEINVSYGGISIKVTCTITADTSMVTQSYAINANNLENESITADKVIDAASGVSVVATSSKAVTIEAHSKTADTKTFTKRIKLAGDANSIVIPNVNSTVAGATANTAITTKVTIYAISGNATNKRFISFTKDEETAPNVAQAVLLDGAEITKCEFMLTEPGTYKFATFKADKFADHPDYASAGSNGGINIYYIQVDKMISNAPAGVENVPLGGEKTYVKLDIDTAEVKKTYKVGDTLDTTGITASAVYANSVTAESGSEAVEASQLTFSELDTSTLGEKTITVTYTPAGGSPITATYKVTVESAVAGITGITASENLESKQVTAADGTVNLSKSNIAVALVGTNAEAVVDSYTVKVDGVDLTDTVALTVGTHTVEVTAVVKAGEATATLTDTLEITITVKPAEGVLSEVSVTFNTNGAVLSIENNTVSSVALDTTNGQIRTQEGDPTTYNTKGTSIQSSALSRRTVTITLKEAGTYNIVVKAKTSSAGRHVICGTSTTDYTTSTTEVANGSFNETTFSNVVVTGTTLIIAADANIDISEIIITPVN
ncbi:MAG: bacterial Ig-like domain-containing protein [Candidatus Coproplasma sp.]